MAAASDVQQSSFVHQTLLRLFPDDGDLQAKFHHIIIGTEELKPLNEWTKEIKQRLDDAARRAFFRAPKSEMKLSPLHVAVMASNRFAIEFFMRIADLHVQQDARGWTPLHHAAASGNREIYDQLAAAGPAALQVKNCWGGTPPQMLEMQRAPEVSDEPVCQLQEVGGLVSCTSKRFLELTSAVFTNRIYAPTDVLYAEWLRPPQKTAKVSLFDTEYVFPHLSDPKPPLALKRFEGQGFGVIACAPVAAGTILGEYTGEFLSLPDPKDPEYTIMNRIDGRRYRNLLSMINDGPPNAGISMVYNHEGLPLRVLLVAIKTILPETPVAFCYGAFHSIKTRWYRLPPSQSAELLPLSQSARELTEMKKEVSLLERTMLSYTMMYILSTPRAVAHMALHSFESIDPLRKLSIQATQLNEKSIRGVLIHAILDASERFHRCSATLPAPQKAQLVDLAFHLIDRQEACLIPLPLDIISENLEIVPWLLSTIPPPLLRPFFEVLCDTRLRAVCLRDLRDQEQGSGPAEASLPPLFDIQATLKRLSV